MIIRQSSSTCPGTFISGWMPSYLIFVLHILSEPLSLRVTLQYITLHCITLHYITLHYITLHYITLHHITSHHITSHRIASHRITSHHSIHHSIHYITLHYIASHRSVLHYIALHHITSHHITSHHITSHHITLHFVISYASTFTIPLFEILNTPLSNTTAIIIINTSPTDSHASSADAPYMAGFCHIVPSAVSLAGV